MREPFTTSQAEARGFSPQSLRWAHATRRVHRIRRGVFLEGAEPPTVLERAAGHCAVTGAVASHFFAAHLLELDIEGMPYPWGTVHSANDSIVPGIVRTKAARPKLVRVQGVQCTDGLQTLLDLAGWTDDLVCSNFSNQPYDNGCRRSTPSKRPFPEWARLECEVPRGSSGCSPFGLPGPRLRKVFWKRLLSK